MKARAITLRVLGPVFFAALFVSAACGRPSARAEEAWRPAKGPLATRWAAKVRPENAHREYPRPQMVRKAWHSLNGLWDYAIRPREDARPQSFDGRILVPFPVESALSGVMKRVGEANRLWYRRTFRLPSEAAWKDKRILLHFGAVDWEAQLWVNGREIGTHRGGYDPFTFDITKALEGRDEHEIVLAVWDPTDAGHQPRGKQVNRPHGIWYTPTTGIWQSVWIEPVAESYIDSLRIVPDVDARAVRVSARVRMLPGSTALEVEVLDSGRSLARARVLHEANLPVHWANPTAVLEVPEVKLWSPENPFLYDLRVRVLHGGEEVDRVESYFGMRKVSLVKDEAGITRLGLNNRPIFMYGTLDQGFWPDGIYTAPSDEALRYDIEVLKKLGFNAVRKHVKVEMARWYYWCDRLGLLVWQDMPNGDRHVGPGRGEIRRSKESAENFERELEAMVRSHFNHPSIVMWVPFNEGWGQYDTRRIVSMIKEWDPTRLVDCASGWNDIPGVGDVHDIHRYPGPAAVPPEPTRASVLGEFGGLGLPLRGHTWQAEKNWGYRSFTTREALTEAYLQLMERLRPLIASPGLSAAIYTQTTDVEIEVNGLMTYDREVIKMPVEKLRAAHLKLYEPPPIVREVIPSSKEAPQRWRYTTETPPAGWEAPDFDDSNWTEGEGGFGTPGTPGAVVRTRWDTPEIWIRRAFRLDDTALEDPRLLIHHDEDAEVYLNGVLAAELKGYTTDYVLVSISAEARAALKRGRNVMAIHCRQTGGGQYIDCGIADVRERKSSADR